MAEYGIKTTAPGDPAGPAMDHTHRPAAPDATAAALERRQAMHNQVAPQGADAGHDMPGY
jgi:hypothetical protein